jgi:membrane associated rhomboid family serine protease
MRRSRVWKTGTGYGLSPGLPMTPVVKALLIANVGIYVIGLLAHWGAEVSFGLVPAEVWGHLQLWRFVTYMFLHGGTLHLLFNMLTLWMFGTAVEAAWGSGAFLRYYLLCGVGGAITTCVASPHSPLITIGASGAVLGILLAYGMTFPDREVLFYMVFPLKAKYLVAIFVAIDLIGVLSQAQDGIAHFAHVGGMLFGFVYLKLDWRPAAMTRKLRATRARWTLGRNIRRHEELQRHVRTVDEILDKISSQGIQSLTEQERKILREASRH